MKRFLFTVLVLITGVGLGGGGLYVANHWDKLNPFKKEEDKAKETLQSFLAGLRKACATDPALKGSLIKSVEVANGKLTLKGVVASRDQAAILKGKGTTLLDETEELRTQCTSGVSTEGLMVLAIHEQLANLQRDFDQGRGAEKDDDENALKRQVMRATRLDAVQFADDGKLVFTAVCIHGNTKTDVTKTLLLDALSSRLDALGILGHVPGIALDVRFFPPPAVTLQKQLEKYPFASNIVVTAARYDAKGILRLDGIVGKVRDTLLVSEALDALAKDAQTAEIVKGDVASNVAVELSVFEGDKRVLELQKKLVEYARKENKPHLRRVRLEQILATALEDDKKKIRTDDEGNILYTFRVNGRLLQIAGDQKQIEKELEAWLVKELPTVPNPDRKPIPPKFAFDVKPSPIFALQERVVQRGLDGAVFTDALFDEKGELELLGRLHQSDDKAKDVLAEAVKDLLAKEPAWNLASLKSHETSKAGEAIAWTDAVRACQAKLAKDSPLSRRVRVDRLYFNYEKEQLGLYPDGVFLAETPKENPDGALRKAIDDVIATRGHAYVKTAGLKHVKNPLVELQNLTAQRSDLDGVLFTHARYGPDGLLHFDGYLGDTAQKAVLTPIVAQRLEQSADLLKKGSDPKTSPGWSIATLKPYASAKGDMKWTEILRACQADLATAPDALFRRACLGRAYFQYAEAKDAKPRRLLLQCNATYLTKPQDDDKEGALKQKIEQKLDAVRKRLLADIGIDSVQADVNHRATPIFDLQKQAFDKKYDGMLFKDAFYDRDGKLAFDGIRGSADQLKQARELLDQLLDDKVNRPLAPAGVAALDGLRLIPWQPMLDDLRGHFAQDKASLYKQTRLDRAYFQYDKSGTKALLHFKGICIYTGAKLKAEEQVSLITDKLQKQLNAKGIDEFTLDIADIAKAANPALEMQAKATAQKLDGIVFAQIGFDAKGNCYVKLPFYPKGQQESVRKLIEEFSKSHPHLGPIREEAYDLLSKAAKGLVK